MAKSIEVSWKQGIYKGYVDVFPIDEFREEVSSVERAHLIRGPKGGESMARYKLHVQNLIARLDYNAFADENERRGIEPGVMEFEFTSPVRSAVAVLRWDDRPVPPSEATVATVSAQALAEAVTFAQQAFARRRLRPGQAQFRHSLDLVYGARCCVSDYGVSLAIDAAHIEPYKDKQSNRVTNGLLMRSDFHALFDAGQMAVNPKSRVVYFSKEARVWVEYENLHGIRKLRGPQPGREASAPAAPAFVVRWKKFVREHGDPESE